MPLRDVGGPAEAVGNDKSARAFRRGMVLVHNNHGSALTRTNRSDEAVGHDRQAIAIAPSGSSAT